MARLSDIIETFLKELINDTNGPIEIQRNELAIKFQCVPSQINYVISTRFSTDKGYYVESRRGGGGYISIRRITNCSTSAYLMHIITSMGDSISQHAAVIFINNFFDYDIVSKVQVNLLKAAVSDKALINVQVNKRDIVRASILKNMLMSIGV